MHVDHGAWRKIQRPLQPVYVLGVEVLQLPARAQRPRERMRQGRSPFAFKRADDKRPPDFVVRKRIFHKELLVDDSGWILRHPLALLLGRGQLIRA
jgi:hypothetical protein